MDGKGLPLSWYDLSDLLFTNLTTVKDVRHMPLTLHTVQITSLVSTIFVTTWLFIKKKWFSAVMHYAVVDEVDSILIDEARTPLIISGHGRGRQHDLYRVADMFV